MKKKIRWGILSTAKIGVNNVIPAMQQGNHCEIAAIASRSSEKAQKAADKLNIEKAAGSYEELLKLPDIDAVYNPLPNHLHVEWSVKALQAGKHVLVEKPVALSFAEAQKLKRDAQKHSGLKVMEAFMYRHHPRWIKVKELVTNNIIGEVRTIRSFFSYYNNDPANIRNKPGIGGGSLMDIGCYGISVPRFLFDEEPSRVTGSMEIDPDLQIDRQTSAIMDFPGGTGMFTSATQLVPHQSAGIFGTKGRIEIPAPFNPPTERPTFLHLFREGEREEIEIAACNQYTIQGDLFSKAILEDKEVPTPLDDALANMNVLDAIVSSSKKRSWVSC